jgi:tetratricopeptide (TPR) repeat protein
VHRALEVYTERLGPDHPDVLSMRGNVGVFAKRQGDYREALTATQAVRDGLEAVLDPDDARVVAIRHQLANVLFVFGRTDDALAMLDVVLEQRRRILGPDDLSVVATHLLAAEVALADGRLGRGERELSAASRLSTRLRPPDRVGELEHDVLMVGLLRARGQLEPAAELAQRERDETEPAKELLARLDVLAGAIACDLGRHEHGAIRLRAAITAVPPRMQHFEIVRARFELARCLTPHAPATARRELSELLDDVRRRGLEGPHVEQIERTLSDL